MLLFNKIVGSSTLFLLLLIGTWGSAISYVYGQETIVPIVSDSLPTISQEKLTLGKRLFHDTRLSSNNALSCATCHPLNKFTVDGLDFSMGADGKPLDYNTPSIAYASLNQYLGWTGSITDLRAHLDVLIHNPREMDTTWPSIVKRLNSAKGYSQQFIDSGFDGINKKSIVDAIIAFETSLAKPSRFDLYLQGEKNQLTAREIEGYQFFKEYGCIACHQGINLGGNMRQTLGVMSHYYSNPKTIKPRDYGYFNITQHEDDKFLFRVPSLRNVAQTSPYFHDASAKTLTQAIKIMFEFQLGLSPKDAEIEAIEAFLHTLDALE